MAPRVVLRLPEDDKENTRLGLSNSLRSRASPCQTGNSLQGNEKKKNAVLFHKSRRVFKVNKVYQTFRP